MTGSASGRLRSNFEGKGERAMRRMIGLMSIVALGFCLTAAGAEDKTPDATLRLSGGSVAAGVGVHWGGGTLNYKGKEYPIDVKGLSVGDVGVTKVEASGKVYNLSKDRKSTRLNSSHSSISYAVFCLKKK